MVLNLKRVWKSTLEGFIGILIETGHQIHFSLTAVLNMTIYQFSELARSAFLLIPFLASATVGLVVESVNVCRGNKIMFMVRIRSYCSKVDSCQSCIIFFKFV
jgi:hypothetical protein